MADQAQIEAPNAWLIRAGKHGEREDLAMKNGVACMGWDQLPDLTQVSSRGEMAELIREALPEASKNKVAAHWSAYRMWTVRAIWVSQSDLE